jgi:hypothetical protein
MNNNVPVEKKIEKEEFISEPTEPISHSDNLQDVQIEEEDETITQRERRIGICLYQRLLPPSAPSVPKSEKGAK